MCAAWQRYVFETTSSEARTTQRVSLSPISLQNLHRCDPTSYPLEIKRECGQPRRARSYARPAAETRPETSTDCMYRAIWSILYAEDEPENAGNAFVTGDKAHRSPRATVYKGSIFYLPWGSHHRMPRRLAAEIARWSRACWMRVRGYQQELYDWPGVPVDLKIRTVRAEPRGPLLWLRDVEHGPVISQETTHRPPQGPAAHRRGPTAETKPRCPFVQSYGQIKSTNKETLWAKALIRMDTARTKEGTGWAREGV